MLSKPSSFGGAVEIAGSTAEGSGVCAPFRGGDGLTDPPSLAVPAVTHAVRTSSRTAGDRADRDHRGQGGERIRSTEAIRNGTCREDGDPSAARMARRRPTQGARPWL
jgi:hypothetical protein